MPPTTKDAARLSTAAMRQAGAATTIAELQRQGELALRRRAERQPLASRPLMALAETQRLQGNFAAAAEIYQGVAATRRSDWRKAAWLHAMLLAGERQLPFAPPSGVWPAPFVHIENFLPRAEHEHMCAIALSLAADFAGGRVGPPEDRRIDESHRRGLAVDHVASDRFGTTLVPRCLALLPSIRRRLRLNPRTADRAVGVSLAAYPHGGFAGPHCDTGPRPYPRLQLHCVYFFHRDPRAFSGGDLLLYDTDVETGDYDRFAFSRIVPASNSLLVLPTSCYHEVTQVTSRSTALADARLSATVLLRGREPRRAPPPSPPESAD